MKKIDLVRNAVQALDWLDLNKGESPERNETCLVYDFGSRVMIWTGEFFRASVETGTGHVTHFISDGPLWLPLPEEKGLEQKERESIRSSVVKGGKT